MAKTKVETTQEVQHSKNFEKVKGYYDTGLWSIERVRARSASRSGSTPPSGRAAPRSWKASPL